MHTGKLSLLLALLLAGVAQAEAPKQDAAVQQVLRKAQGALRQLSEEKARLEADNAGLQKNQLALEEKLAKLEAAVKQLEPLQGELEKQKAATEAAKNANTALEGQLASGKAREQTQNSKLEEIIAQARKIQGDNLLLVEAVQEREQWIGQCQQKNANLAEAHAQLIQHYEDKGFWDKLADVEPLTGIGRVKTENAVQGYQFKLEDLKATPFQSQPKESAGQEGRAKLAVPEVEGDE